MLIAIIFFLFEWKLHASVATTRWDSIFEALDSAVIAVFSPNSNDLFRTFCWYFNL